MAVIETSVSEQPVSLQACKSSLAHSEACAGIVGLLHTVLVASQQQAARLVHLRSLSTHCQATMETTRLAISADRMSRPLPTTALAACGVNSFAYQVHPY